MKLTEQVRKCGDVSGEPQASGVGESAWPLAKVATSASSNGDVDDVIADRRHRRGICPVK